MGENGNDIVIGIDFESVQAWGQSSCRVSLGCCLKKKWSRKGKRETKQGPRGSEDYTPTDDTDGGWILIEASANAAIRTP